VQDEFASEDFSMTELSGSVFETLRDDGEFVLRRTGMEGLPTLLLAPASDQPALESLKRLEREYLLRDELDPTWAVRPRALTREHGRLTLLLDDPGGELLVRLIGKPWDVTPFLRVAISGAIGLGRLHRQGLVHKDVKPANMLVNRLTGEVWLTGFGFTLRLPRERQAPEPPAVIAGTLAYMAPEQTGRMNRSIDARSDLYACGVTLYEMLTGTLPFLASEPMEWIHCHIARQPEPPAERVHGIPSSISAIVLKLLSKNAEDRYQTAAGLEADLRQCLAEWESRGAIDPFPLGAHDASDRLLIPEKLYGREPEVATLFAAFDRVVASGIPELVMVSGYSGVGKSAVVQELHRALVPPRGLFASGKFDQYKRSIPYATLAQAFRSLLLPILSQRAADLVTWRDAIQQALGTNGQLIVNLIPELELIIGKQPLVADLPPRDTHHRFQMVFRRFLSVFARKEHPLALFLDDLQWLDAATLDLLEYLVTEPEVKNLLLIGAYRDNEVSSSHPLMRTLEAIRRADARVHDIVLSPLALDDVVRLVAETVHCEREDARPLAQLVYEKTAGNPFFAIQFITGLAGEGLIAFDPGAAAWTWDVPCIRAKGYTDNVVDLMLGKLNRLPATTQEAVKQLACLGYRAETATLSLMHGASEEETHAALWEAVRAGLVFRLEGAYTFLHDRVQEAAYALIPDGERAAVHLRIGRLLAAHTPPERLEEAIFEIVNQLNRAAALITAPEERERVAELNLIAGRRAKTSTAYASALNYFAASGALLAEDRWERRRELTFALELHRAECEFLTAELTAAEERLTLLSSRAANTVEQATVACLRMDLYTTLAQSDRALTVCFDYLRHLGVAWSPHPTEEEARQEYERIWSQLGTRPIEELIELPVMTDLASLATLDVLTKLVPPALFTDANLLALAICRMVNLSLGHGNTDGSCFAYVWLGMIAGPHFGDYKAGLRFGRLGYELVEKRGLKRFQAATYMCFGHGIMPWTENFRACCDLLRRTFDAANKIGDLTFAAYSCNALNTDLLAAGDALGEVQREAEHGLAFAQQVRFGLVVDVITAQLGLIRTLRGLTPRFGSFDDGQFDERRFERHLASAPVLALPECWYWVRKLQARFFAGDYAAAVDAAVNAQRLLWTSPSLFETAEYHFYGALAHAASWNSASPDQRPQHFEALAAHHRQLEVWAENCPENFANRAALVGAEIARLEGRALDAEHLYEQAIRLAREQGFFQNEGLANERAAQFYAARGFETIAHAYLRHARYCYLRWGAEGKVRQLDQTHPHLREEPGPQRLTTTMGAPVEHLDLATVVKMSQVVFGEIVLEQLIDVLMTIAVEHAGAERGLLILLRGDALQIEAEATTARDGVEVRPRQTGVTPLALPESILHYVIRTQESVILDDASVENLFSTDEYTRQNHLRSVLCLPLVKQAKPIGVLYLENNLTPHVFTPERIVVLKLLASQAAISLENARLYSDLRQENSERQRAEDALLHTQAELAHVNRVATLGELTASIAHEVNQPLAAVVNNASACLRWLAAHNLEEARQSAALVIADGHRAGEIVGRIRALVKKAPLQKEWLDINDTIREVIALIRSEVHRNGIALETQVSDDVHYAPLILADRIQLQQVLLNLIINAIEAMSGGDDGPRELLVCSGTDESRGVLVAVRDSGPGLDPQSLERLFDAFYTTKPHGLGMGLAISRSIIEAHGGRLWATANEGRGATFQFTLPTGGERAS
jgi:predicted ATPase/signal transduction histidine kinase